MSPAASWNGSLVQVSKFTDTVRAEAGIGAGRPSVTIANAPVVSWWNGTGYSTTTITNSTAAQHLTVAPVTAVDPSTGYRAVSRIGKKLFQKIPSKDQSLSTADAMKSRR